MKQKTRKGISFEFDSKKLAERYSSASDALDGFTLYFKNEGFQCVSSRIEMNFTNAFYVSDNMLAEEEMLAVMQGFCKSFPWISECLCKTMGFAMLEIKAFEFDKEAEEFVLDENNFMKELTYLELWSLKRIKKILGKEFFGDTKDKLNRFISNNLPAACELYEVLRKLRKELAEEKSVSAFLIFTNKTLIDMCIRLPKNKEEMLTVNGVGEVKYEKYGERFIKEIEMFLKERPDELTSISEDVEDIKEIQNQNKSKISKQITEFSLTEAGCELFAILHQLRATIAHEKSIDQFYSIFSNKTLVDMCAKLPNNKEEMLNVFGVGEVKYEKYGERFIKEIEMFLKEKPNVVTYLDDEE